MVYAEGYKFQVISYRLCHVAGKSAQCLISCSRLVCGTVGNVIISL